jgi:hypothetical protein
MRRQPAIVDPSPHRRRLTFVLALAFMAIVAVPSVVLSRLYGHMEALSADARHRDANLTARELDRLTGFYQTARSWHLEWLADPLFADAFLQRAAAAYVAGDYERVVADLRERVDDPRAVHLLGCARFRIAQRRYRSIAARDPNAVAMKNAIIQEVIDQVNPDFEHAVRADRTHRFADKWNYDLTSDPAAIRRALEAPPRLTTPELDERHGTKSPARTRRG